MRESISKLIFNLAICLVAVSSPAAVASLNCGGPALNTNQPPYSLLPEVLNSLTTIHDEEAVRSDLMTRLVGAYRAKNGITSLPAGSSVRVIYEDQTRECGLVVTPIGSMGVVPVPGSSREGPGGGTGGVENTNMYIRQFQRNGLHGSYQVCYDYYSNGELTETQCSVQTW